jgi:uncharacterized protein YndB with AHSA1/START domain
MAISFSVEQFMDAPPDQVFDAMADLDGAKHWMPGLVSLDRLDAGALGPGSRWKETRKVFGKEAFEVFEVTEFVRPSRLGLRVDGSQGTSGRGEYLFQYYLEPENSGTHVWLDGEIRGLSGLYAFLGRLMVISFKKACAKDLQALSAYLSRRKAGAV